MTYEKENKQTGEYIHVEIENVRVPEDIGNPLINNSRKTYNTKMERMPGWHFILSEDKTTDEANFYPDYRKVQGPKQPLKILKGKTEIVVKINNQHLNSRIKFGAFLKYIFPHMSQDVFDATVGISLPARIASSIRIPSEVELHEQIAKKASEEVFQELRLHYQNIYVKQTQITNPKRLQDLFSVVQFEGDFLASSLELEGRVFPKGTQVTKALANKIDYSDLTKVELLDKDGERYVVTCPKTVYKEETFYNSMQVYISVLNRLVNFRSSGISFDSTSYENQELGDLMALVEEINSVDLEKIEAKVSNSPSFIAGISSIHFDKARVEKKISSDDTSLVTLANMENPFSTVANSGATKTVKPVKNLSAKDAGIRLDAFGYEDGTDVGESKNLGKSVPINVTTKIKDGTLWQPLYVVREGAITDEVVEVSVRDAHQYFIAEFNADLSKKRVQVRHNDAVMYVNPKRVTHARTSPFSSTSMSRGTSPYIEHIDNKRASMGAKTAEQSRYVIGAEAPLVSTGVESILINEENNFTAYRTVHQIFQDYVDELSPGTGQQIDLTGQRFSLKIIKQLGKEREYMLYNIDNPMVSKTFSLEIEVTPKGSLNQNIIVPPKGEHYTADDVVWRNSMVHLDPPDKMNLGRLKYHSKGDDSYFDYTVGVGVNVKTMTGFYLTDTVDDASVMSDKLLRRMSMSTPSIIKKTFEKPKNFNNTEEGKSGTYLGNADGSADKPGFYDGLPNVGTKIYGGMPLIYKYKTLESNPSFKEQDNFYLAFDEAGEVISVEIKQYEIVIHMYAMYHLTVGDKFSGRHGNKTVLSKIVPHEQMPYDPETGEVVELIMNPTSIISRNNKGQIIEMYQANEAAANGKRILMPPFEKPMMDLIQKNSDMQHPKLKPMMDGATGQFYGSKMFVGNLYLLRLVQLAEDKVHSIGNSTELDPAFLQPVGHGAGGGNGYHSKKGQGIGAYERDIMAHLGLEGLLQETLGLLSSDTKQYNEMVQSIKEDGENFVTTNPGTNKQADHIKMSTLSLQVAYSLTNGESKFQFASDEILRKYPKLDSLNFDNDVTHPKLTEDFSYIELEQPVVPHTVWKTFNLGNVVRVLAPDKREFTKVTPVLAASIVKGEKTLFWLDEDHPKAGKYKHTNCWAIHANLSKDVVERSRGMETIIEMLEDQDLDDWTAHHKKYKTFDGKVNSQIEHIRDTGGIKQFISNCFPVMPVAYRMSSKDKNVLHELTQGYRKVNSAKGQQNIYQTIEQFMQKGFEGGKSIAKFIFDKDKGGRMRNNILKIRVKHSGRANLAPAGFVHPDWLGIPIIMAFDLFQPFIVSEIRKQFPSLDKETTVDGTFMDDRLVEIVKALLYQQPHTYKKISNMAITSKREVDKMFEIIKKVAENQLVHYNRAPVLQQDSVRGGRVYINPRTDLTVRISTLVTEGMNADFDGDQVPVATAFTEKAKEEIRTKLLPSTNVLRPNEGAVSLKINQDSLLGLYLSTKDEPAEDVNPIYIRTAAQAWNILEASSTGPSYPVRTPKGELTTLGRFLASAIINSEHVGDIHVLDKKAISTISNILASKYSSPRVTQIIFELQSMGYKMVNKVNLTMSLKDFEPALKTSKMSFDTEEFLEKSYRLEELGLLPKEWKERLSNEINNYKKSVQTIEGWAEDNSLKIFIESGVKGSTTQIGAMFGILGEVPGREGKLPVPVLNGYVSGLSQFESENMAFNQRINAVSTVHETSEPGAAFRSGSFLLSGAVVNALVKDSRNVDHFLFYKHNEDPDQPTLLQPEQAEPRFKMVKHVMHPTGNPIEGLRFMRELDGPLKALLDATLKVEQKTNLRQALRTQERHADIKTLFNMFSCERGIDAPYIGPNILTRKDYGEGDILSIAASTALSSVATQLKISKRHGGAGEDTFNAVQMYTDAVSHGKVWGDDKTVVTHISAVDGEAEVQQGPMGTHIILKADDHEVYPDPDHDKKIIRIGVQAFWIPFEEESKRQIKVINGQRVSKGQIISYRNEFKEDPYSHFHPELSFSSQDPIYGSFFTRDSDVATMSRYFYYRYLYELFSSVSKVYPLYIALYATQQTRTVETKDGLLKDYATVQESKEAWTPRILGARDTIINTSGHLATYIYQDASKAVAKSQTATNRTESAYITKMAIGVPLGTDNATITQDFIKPREEVSQSIVELVREREKAEMLSNKTKVNAVETSTEDIDLMSLLGEGDIDLENLMGDGDLDLENLLLDELPAESAPSNTLDIDLDDFDLEDSNAFGG